MIRELTFHNLTLDRIHIGKPAGAAAVLESDLRGAKRVVIVTPQVIVDQTPIVQPIIDALGDKFAGMFTDLIDHVPRSAVFALADFFRETNADLVSPLVDGRRWIQ